ncbi:MAG: hypothetical protein AVDCRST_MAG59-2950, partial [uncultured Thermomicrobiales bacterium]
AGQRPAADDPAGDRGDHRQKHLGVHRRVQCLRPAGSLGLPAQDGLSRSWRVRAGRGRRRVLRGPRQHVGRVLVSAALLAPAPSGHLAGEAAGLSRLLPDRPQRPASRKVAARCPCRRLGRV